jgi:DNA (cytosine-5)-methyltransferase 1
MKISQVLEILNANKVDLEIAAEVTHFLQTDSKSNRSLRHPARNVLKNLLGGLLPADVSWDVPFAPPTESKFKFIDLFAGVGGMRLAFEGLGGKCVFSSEWDKSAQITYATNFGEIPHGDITAIDETDVPNHDVLVAGFPCQAFSIAGARGGFEDTRGTLFFDVARIIREKKPDAFFLENVKGLMNHDRKRTIATILKVLREDLGYCVPDPQVMNAMYFGVPQHRERVFIVGFRSKAAFSRFQYPAKSDTIPALSTILEKKPVSVKYYMSTQYMQTLENHKQRHEERGNGFGYAILSNDGVANAIVVGGMGRERNLVIDKRLKNLTPITNIKGAVNTDGIRRMTPREWARLQGFDDRFLIPVSDAQAYKQFGNSVAVPAIAATAQKLLEAIRRI